MSNPSMGDGSRSVSCRIVSYHIPARFVRCSWEAIFEGMQWLFLLEERSARKTAATGWIDGWVRSGGNPFKLFHSSSHTFDIAFCLFR